MISKEHLDKAFEEKNAAELVKAPIDALQGVSAGDAARMKEAFGIDNIGEMAALRYYQRAKIILKKAQETQ